MIAQAATNRDTGESDGALVALGDVTAPKVDQRGPTGGEFVYVDIGSVDNRLKRIVEPKELDAAQAPSRAKQRLRAGDVLVSMTRPNLNAVAMVPPELDGAVGSTGFHVLRANDDTDPRWLYYAVQTHAFVAGMSDLVQGALYPAVRPKDIRAFQIPHPPVVKQRRIVAEIEKQFSRLDEAIANLNRVNTNLDRYLTATLTEAFAGCWGADKATWQLKPLRSLADIQLGQQRAPVHTADSNQTPYIRAANITWQGIDLTDVKSMGFPNVARYRLAYGDVLLAEASGSASEVGRPAIWRNELPGACYQKTLIRVRCRPEVLNFEFAYYFFLLTCLSGQFAKLAPGVGILHLTAERMLDWPTPAPPLMVQYQVVTELDRQLSFVSKVKSQLHGDLSRADVLRQTVLSRSFAGIRPTYVKATNERLTPS